MCAVVGIIIEYSVLFKKPVGVSFYPATLYSQLVTELSDVITVTTR